MIVSKKDRRIDDVMMGRRPKRFPSELMRPAQKALRLLDAAATLASLRSPPSLRLEPLHGDRAGQWSVRINDQWRLCFRWTDEGPEDVEIVDYH